MERYGEEQTLSAGWVGFMASRTAVSGVVGGALRGRVALSGLVVLLSSLAGALVFPLSSLGRTTPQTASKEWVLLLAGSWVLLAAWALSYAAILRGRAGFSFERSLYWSALCHSPLLLCLGLVAALYGSDTANHLYSGSPYGQLILQPLAKGFVLATPAVAQLLRLAIRSRSAMVGGAIFAMIAGTSILLRFWNLDWGLPGRFHPDEYSGRALNMIATHDLNPHFFKNPTVMIYLIYGVQQIAAQMIQPFQLAAQLLGLGLQDPRNDFLLLVVGRWVAATAGALTVGVVYLTGKEILDRKAGLVAALLIGVSFLHIRNSHYATNDVLATLLLSLSFLFSARIYTRGRFRDYLLAALFGGLAASTKYTASLFVLPILVAHLARPDTEDARSLLRRHSRLLICGAVSVVAFLAGTPYALLDSSAFLADFRYQFALGAEFARGRDPLPTPAVVLATLTQGLGVVAMLCALLGTIFIARHDFRRLVLLVLLPLAFFVSIANQQYFYARFVVPLLPFLALLAAHGVATIAPRLGKYQLGNAGLPLLAALALAQPLALSLQHDLLLGREDTRTLAASWIESNASPDATVAVETHSLMDNPYGWRGHPDQAGTSYWNRDIQVFWPEKEDQMGLVLQGAFDYVVVTSWGYDSLWGGGSDLSGVLPRYQALDSLGQVVARFGPGPNGTDLPYAVDDSYTPFWHLFDRERPGPTVKVYRMK